MNKWVKLNDILEIIDKTINELNKEIDFYKNNKRYIEINKVNTYEGQSWEHWNNMFGQADSNKQIIRQLVKELKALSKNQSQSDTKGNPVLCKNCGHEHLSWITNDTKFHSLNVCSAYKCRCNKFEMAVNN